MFRSLSVVPHFLNNTTGGLNAEWSLRPSANCRLFKAFVQSGVGNVLKVSREGV